MATASGSGGIAGWVWGLLAGAAVAAIGGGLYIAGVFGPAPAPEPAVEKPAVQATEPAPEAKPEAKQEAKPEPKPEPAVEKPAAQATGPAPEAKPEAKQEAKPEPKPGAEPTPAAEAETPAEPAAEATAEVAQPAPAAEDKPAPALPPLAAPSFDLVRVETDGTAVIAGRATPASTVTVLLDEAEIDSFAIADTGEFVSFLTLAASDLPRVMTLRAEFDGQTVLSEDQIILAPTPRPEPVAEPLAEAKVAAAEATAKVVEMAQKAVAEPETKLAEALAPVMEPAPQAGAASEEAAPVAEQPTEQVAKQAVDAGPAPATPPAEPAATADTSAAQPAPVTVLRAGAAGVELVQPATAPAPEVMDQIALDTISYTETGDVLIAGRAGVLSVVRVYLDNKAIAELAAGEDGRWQGQLAGVEPGVYVLRLDEVNAQGEVVSRLETPFKREAPEALRPPAAPAAGDPKGAPLVRVVTVQKGDTLWAISRERYGEGLLYVRVFEANRDRIRNPDLIYPGQVFTIPE